MSGLSQYKNQALLHFVILLWGFTGILGKLITLPSDAMVIWRMAIAFVCLMIYLPAIGFSIKVTWKEGIRYIGVGLLVALHWVTFFEAVKVSTVSVALATVSSASLFTALLEPLFFKRRIIGYELIFGVLVVVGLLIIFNYETQYYLGILYALAAAFLASLFTTINGVFVAKGARPKAISLYEMLGGTLGIGAYFLVFGDFDVSWLQPSASDMTYLIILGVLCTAFAFVVSVEVMKELSPFTVSISINMEPVYSIVLALLIFGEEEKMTPGFYTGALLIMATILANAWLKQRQRRKARLRV